MFEEIVPHIVELRKRLVISVLAIVAGFGFCFLFWQEILDFILVPLNQALPSTGEVIFTHPAEGFFMALKVSMFGGFVIALPVVFYQIWQFVAPGLYDSEKKYVMPFVAGTTVMFLIGASFCYFIVLPIAFDFLINFGSGTFTAMPKIGEYVGFFIKLILAFGISFELPIMTYFLALIGLVTDEDLKGFFRYAIVIIFVFAAIMTPPDVISQFLLGVPLVILYAGSIYIARAVNPAKPLFEEEDES